MLLTPNLNVYAAKTITKGNCNNKVTTMHIDHTTLQYQMKDLCIGLQVVRVGEVLIKKLACCVVQDKMQLLIILHRSLLRAIMLPSKSHVCLETQE